MLVPATLKVMKALPSPTCSHTVSLTDEQRQAGREREPHFVP